MTMSVSILAGILVSSVPSLWHPILVSSYQYVILQLI